MRILRGKTQNAITYGETVAVLRAIVNDHGFEHVYTPPGPGGQCVYVHDGKPSCLVGHVLHRLGLALPPSEQGMSNGWLAVVSADKDHRYPFDDAAIKLLAQVQARQDGGMPWGLVVREAINQMVAEGIVPADHPAHRGPIRPPTTLVITVPTATYGPHLEVACVEAPVQKVEKELVPV